jgi:hypothetical protein
VKDLELVRRMAALDPAPVFMGGYAKEALLHGGLTRPHEDFDWLLPRSEAAARIEQAKSLGFGGWQTVGEAAPGEPFYMAGEGGGHKLELGICDKDGGRLTTRELRERFLPEVPEADLMPLRESIP